ncbi:MAG TPA: hypothetical protein VIH18_11315 [Candidatus Binatia bacterium]|jgi:hypothetical protein
MNPWQLMFLQSKVNDNPYTGDSLAMQNWAWPQGTWFQKRLRHLRRKPWLPETLRSTQDAGQVADLCHPRIMPTPVPAENETRSKEASYESFTSANASGGTEHFACSATSSA